MDKTKKTNWKRPLRYDNDTDRTKRRKKIKDNVKPDLLFDEQKSSWKDSSRDLETPSKYEESSDSGSYYANPYDRSFFDR